MSKLDLTDPQVLSSLSAMLTAAGVSELEITTPDAHVRLVVAASCKMASSPVAAAELTNATASKAAVNAPVAGHFFAMPSSEADMFPRDVAADDVIAFIRIGHVLVPIMSGRRGSLVAQLVVSDALVGFGDPLFEIELQS